MNRLKSDPTSPKANKQPDTTPAFSLDRTEFAKRLADPDAGETRAVVLHPDLPFHGQGGQKAASVGFLKRTAEARLTEAVGLAEAIKLQIIHSSVVAVSKIRPATLIGLGTVEAMVADFDAQFGPHSIDVVVIDGTLTPVQQRNLEKAFDCKVIDRTGLILEIFGARARTKEGRLQVELAALTYQRSRLVRSWTHLERQRGGQGFMGGPGETQIETDRRLIDDRIVRLKKDLGLVRKTRGLHRSARKRVPYPIVALVGYTNAGKSTLFNAVTNADVLVEDQVFATLDPTMRSMILPSGRTVILSDTVGFVSDLPHELVEAFRATLEEVEEADLVIHVRDAAHPDADAQRSDVLAVLDTIGIRGNEANTSTPTPMIEVFNKIDDMTTDERSLLQAHLNRSDTPAVMISALTAAGLPDFLAQVEEALDANSETLDVRIPFSDGETLAWVYRNSTVVERADEEAGTCLRTRMSALDKARFEQRIEQGQGAGVTITTAPA